jgi:alkylation response protein AidB-like acyl-CoA dehydrogenase
MRFEPTELTDTELDLQADVREFLVKALPRGSYQPALGMDAEADHAFSRALAARGWVGMALPKKYGGHDRSSVDRFIVAEELLRSGAPIGYHWVADRQSGPIINRFGTEAQKERFLPAICRGELGFSIGMSEPDSGSDLASLSMRAIKADGGWILNGTKTWTTRAHDNDWLICLCRTSPRDEGNPRDGMSQLLVDLESPGLQVNGIPILDGTTDFNEVVMNEVFVPDVLVLGEVGAGWIQNTSELGYERGGPDRWLSTFGVVEAFLASLSQDQLTDDIRHTLGRLVARFWGLRNLSLTVARMIDSGDAPSVESALVKEMATRFEQDTITALLELTDFEPSPESSDLFERLFVRATLTGPAFTIRGGTTEILRSVAAKGLRR